MSGESEKPLGGDGGGGAIDGFPGVVRVGGFVQVTAQAMQMRGTRVPHGDAVGAGVFEVKLRRGIRGALDSSAIDTLTELFNGLRADGVQVIAVARANEPVLHRLQRAGLVEPAGDVRSFATINAAVKAFRERHT